jgi:hypothetical protein
MVDKPNIGPPHVNAPTSFHRCLMVSTQAFALITSVTIEILIRFPPLITLMKHDPQKYPTCHHLGPMALKI